MTITKDQFENTSDRVIGVVTVNSRGDQKGLALHPGDTVWLNEEEQALTANAPKREEDNPLANGSLTLKTEGAQIKNARPLRPTEVAASPPPAAPPVTTRPPEETGAAPIAAGAPPEGERPPGEEVATPEAVPQEAPEPEPVAQPATDAAATTRRRAPAKS